MKNLNQTIKAAIIVIAVASLLVGGVYAATLLTSPSSDPVTVNATPTPTPSPTPIPVGLSKVTVNTQTLTVGEQLTISTTISNATPDLIVNFYNQNNAAVGSAVTDALGTATLNLTPPIGTWTYYAQTSLP